MKKYFKHLLIILISVSLSSSCSNDDDEIKSYSLIGSWKYLNATITFNENFTGIMEELDYKETFTWSSDGDQLTIETPDGFLTWTYTVSATTLTIIYSNGDKDFYTRQ